ncbi:MAG TPA: DUF1501 domain-containing protein [Myxococcales bacterium]|nr:DUF1501 domain-containing protein [Myxococcales bacterium]
MILTRRRFLKSVGATGVLAAAGCKSMSSGGGDGPGTPPIAIPMKPILVVVDIDGGNDWLNMMPPLSGANRAAYESKRPTLAIATDHASPLPNGAGLNADFTGMDELDALGRVAWIPGIGMNNPNLSHFVSIDLWGQGAAQPGGTGWLGRFADRAFDTRGDVLRGLTVTSDRPLMLRGSTRSFVSITSASGFVYPSLLRSGRVGAPYSPQLLEDGFAAAVTSTTSDAPSAPDYAAAAISGKLFLDAQNGFGTDGNLPARTPSVLYPGDADYPIKRTGGGNLSANLSNQFKLIAQMLAAGLPTEVFFTRLGGWDTHSNQTADHPNLMRALGGSISAFYEDLASVQTAEGNAQDRVMILAWSEFGRRVAENKGGTDHGTAGLSFCVGRAVKGGIYGDYPDLASLDKNGNLKFTVDFRSLYATVLDRWLGQAPSATDAMLGAAYQRLGFL